MEEGENTGPEVDKYFSGSGLNPGLAWCALFVRWNYLQCGYTPSELGNAYSPSWFPKDKVVWTRGDDPTTVVMPGDVFGIYYASKRRVAHVGIIQEWLPNSRYCTTIEGNTNGSGAREGDGVYVKIRSKNGIYILSRYR